VYESESFANVTVLLPNIIYNFNGISVIEIVGLVITIGLIGVIGAIE
jgi:hypothetical protein